MIEGNCGTCDFYKPIDRDSGECRCGLPIIIPRDAPKGVWPEVQKSDWCGRHYVEDRPATQDLKAVLAEQDVDASDIKEEVIAVDPEQAEDSVPEKPKAPRKSTTKKGGGTKKAK